MGKFVQRLGVSDRTWRDPHGNRWRATIEWAEIDGRAECVGLALRSFSSTDDDRLRPLAAREDVRPLRVDVLRAFPMSIISEARAAELRWMEDLGPLEYGEAEMADGYEPHEVEALEEDRRRFVDALAADGRGRRLTDADGRPLPADDALAEVARVYRTANRTSTNPTKAVAETFKLSRSAAAKRVARARKSGLLPPTEQGIAKSVGSTTTRRNK